MASLARAMTRRTGRAPSEQRRSLSLDDYAAMFTLDGQAALGFPFMQQTLTGDREEIGGGFAGLAQGAFGRNSVVFSCIALRMDVFSEIEFQFQNKRDKTLFGTGDLGVLENPWPGGTTGDLLARMEIDVSLAGNAFVYRKAGGNELRRLRPDWVTIVLGTRDPAVTELIAGDPRVEVIGYSYKPGGPGSGADPMMLLPSEVAHYAPRPDPLASWRGMSWLTPLIREVEGDSAAMAHKLNFYRNGATVNLVVTLGDIDPDEFEKWVAMFREDHEGTANAYKTLFFAAGADAKPVGSNLKDLDFTDTQGHGEVRIAAAARTPAILVGLTKGLDSATYSNATQARRWFADSAMRPMWRNAAGSLARIVTVPPGARLWYDASQVAALQDEQKDRAAVTVGQSTSVAVLVREGWDPDAAVRAVAANDLTLLVGKHSGLVSVQLHPADGSQPAGASSSGDTVKPSNGSGPSADAANALTAMAALTTHDDHERRGGAGDAGD